MSAEQSAESAPPEDGFCPVCDALADQACSTPSGAVRPDHAGRHPMPHTSPGLPKDGQ